MKMKQNIKLMGQAGVSLVEVLVAMVISLFLLAGIVQVYLGNKTTFAFTNALAEIQENGRYALDVMTQDIRMAGEWGCVAFDPDDTSNINNTLDAVSVPGYTAATHAFEENDAVNGTDNTGLNGSDTVTIMGGKPGQTNVESPFTRPAVRNITTNAINSIQANDIILLARCGKNDLKKVASADILRVTGIANVNADSQRQINLSSAKSQQFENDATVIELQTVTYSIANGANGEPSLWRSEFGNNVELVEGVEDMQILYGIDTDAPDPDGYPNQYVTSDNVGDFGAVVAVRVMLLVRSIDDFVTEDPQTYTFNNITTTPGDRRIRQNFTTTIALRNRIGVETLISTGP